VLGERATRRMAHSVAAVVRMAHEHGERFRLTEMNSVTCGGLKGVSNTFATALWAPDALFELLRVGVDGVNLHVRAGAINAPFKLGVKGLEARPLLYGMALFARALGPRAQLVAMRVHGRRPASVKVWAVRVSGGGLRVLAIDEGRRGIRIQLRLPARGPAQVQRLRAASPASRWGVTLAGQHLGPDGRWRGRRRLETVPRTRAGYALNVPGDSAALLSVSGPAA
jgi:hypothetical protein